MLDQAALLRGAIPARTRYFLPHRASLGSSSSRVDEDDARCAESSRAAAIADETCTSSGAHDTLAGP